MRESKNAKNAKMQKCKNAKMQKCKNAIFGKKIVFQLDLFKKL